MGVGPLSPSSGERGEPISASVSLTEAGKVMGTPQYMAPEQTERPGEVDHRADIYALGVVFYQMLTGQLPDKRIEPPSRKVQLDVRLDEIVLRALEKEPERRYQQASVLKTEVETIAAGVPVTSRAAKSLFVHFFETLSGIAFTSSAAIKTLNLSALGFLGLLSALGTIPLAGMRWCFGFAGFFGFFGLIGVAYIIEIIARRTAAKAAQAMGQPPEPRHAGPSNPPPASPPKRPVRMRRLGVYESCIDSRGLRDCWIWDSKFVLLTFLVPFIIASIVTLALVPKLGSKAILFQFLDLVGIVPSILFLLLGRPVRRLKANLSADYSEACEAVFLRGMNQQPGLAVLYEDRLEFIPVFGAKTTVAFKDILSVRDIQWFNGVLIWWKAGFSFNTTSGERIQLALPEPVWRRWREYWPAAQGTSTESKELWAGKGEQSLLTSVAPAPTKRKGVGTVVLGCYQLLLTLLCLIWASLAIQAAAEGGGAWHSAALLMAVLLIVPTTVFCGLNGIRLFAPARFASPRWTVVGGTSYVFTGLATVLFAWLLIFETTWHRSVNEFPATFDQRPSNATAAASGESPADVDKAKAPRELALARAKTAGTKRQRFEPKQGMENKSSWGVVPKPPDLNSNGWAGIAYMSLGGVAPITIPGEAEPVCKLKLTKGNDDQITLDIEDLKQKNTLTVTLGRDQPAEILVNGKGYRVRYCAVRVNLDQPDSSPFAQVILKPVEGPVEPSRTVMATGALKRAPLDSATWQIEAMVAEADIAPVAAGQEVSFTIDAVPRRKFRGKVVAVADVPTLVQKVNWYATTIEAI